MHAKWKLMVFLLVLIITTRSALANEELITAVTEGDFYKTHTLLAEGADPNYEIAGLTPLLVAIFSGADPNLIDLLISYGVDLNWVDEDGYSILIYALISGSSENTIRLLLSAGASVNHLANDGISPLVASIVGETDVKVIKLLLDAGAQVNLADEDGITPLILAVLFEENEAKINLLLDYGADVFQEMEDGVSAFDLIDLNEELYDTDVYWRVKNANQNMLSFSFSESLVPEATGFPAGDEDEIVTDIIPAFYMAQYEVTYKLWKEVYNWAVKAGYSFWEEGQMGSNNNEDATPDHPVTKVAWYDAINWCNALTEYYNQRNNTSLAPVYYNNGEVIKNSRPNVIEDLSVDSSAKGFRLPTIIEWDLAARYQDGETWLSGDYVSGGAHISSPELSNYVWNYQNSGSKTNPVGLKLPNFLGIYDLSGNVSELCFDRYLGPIVLGNPNRDYRITRGADFFAGNDNMRLARIMYIAADASTHSVGFRVVRTK